MSSRAFKARTPHTPENPQICGLTGAHIQEDDLCLFLVCDGKDAKPEYQVVQVDEVEYQDSRGKTRTRKVYESKQGRPFRCIWTGEWESFVKADGKKGRRRVYEWQVEGADGSMFSVDVWSNMVHVKAALDLGFEVRRKKDGSLMTTSAFKGDRTRGNEHRVSKEAEAPLVTLAKAALSDEEAGLVAPKSEQATAQSVEASDDAADAAALNMTVEQYRKLLAS